MRNSGVERGKFAISKIHFYKVDLTNYRHAPLLGCIFYSLKEGRREEEKRIGQIGEGAGRRETIDRIRSV